MTPTWKMPKWMERYRDSFVNTGGNTIEDLMNRDPKEANVVINAPVALLCVAVKSQVSLLHVLHKKGLLP
jgi:hypothetical protein